MTDFRAALVPFACTLALAACAARPPADAPTTVAAPSILGTWAGDDRTTFVFRDGGEALWVLPISVQPDTFRIRYRYDASAAPAHLDLSGFEQGPLAGRTLFCIVERAGTGVFRMDCEPGASESARPAAFNPAQTRTYRRQP